MKINKIILSVSSLAVCGTLSAQDLRGVVRDADNQPLVGASVYWEGTTIGASTDAQGAFLLHRVKGYDNLVASYLGYVNDTLRVAGGAERIEFTLASEGVALEDVVVEGNLSGNFVKRDGIVKGEMISFAGLCKMACRELRELGVGDRRVQRRHFGRTADQDARPGRYLYPDPRRKPPDHARAERPLRTELHARHVAQFDSGVEGRGVGDGRA
jgi:hypothetical protein